MNEAMNYLIECIQNNKKPSGKKLKTLNQPYDVQTAYEIVHGKQKCEVCKNDSKFINTKKGFAKYCSQECYNVVVSNDNKKLNAERNIRRSKESFEKNRELLEKAKNEYLNSSLTIKETAAKFHLTLCSLRKFLLQENCIKKRSSYSSSSKVSKRTDDITNGELKEKIDTYLNDELWVNERLNHNWSIDHFASFFGCSKTYIAKILKEKNIITLNVFSNQELILRNFLHENNVEFEMNVKGLISNKEIDLYIPSHNLAIEINGLYWHSDTFKKREYHLEKTSLCESKGIHLLHFFENEINYKREIVFSLIKNFLKMNETLPARKCTIEELGFKEKNEFFSLNHISGDVPSSIAYGLFYEGRCVAAMSFGVPRFNKNYDFELLRFCNERNLNVIGGANRLFKHFNRKNKYSKIISYSQRRLFKGDIYKTLGFSFIRNSQPNYFWANKNTSEVYSRYQCQKHKLKTNKTEKEHMENLGFVRIWDCGNSCWEYIQ